MIEHGIEAVISKHVGPKAFRVLNAAKVNVYLTEESHMKDALQKLQAGEMQPALKNDVEGHHQ
jgi:predicted Fe-Mo cluster-binding NifX family protein